MPESALEENPRPAVEPSGGLPDALTEGGLRGSSRLVRSLAVFALVGVVLYAGATVASDYDATIFALVRFPGATLLLVLGLVLAGWLIRGWRFHYYLMRAGMPVSLAYSIAVFLASFALTGTPGKMGEAVKGIFLKEDYGIPITSVVGILVIERLMDLWAVLLLGSFSFLLFSEWIGAFVLCAAVVILGGISLCMESAYRPVLDRIGRIRGLAWPSEKVLGILLTGRGLMTPRVILVGLAASISAWAMESVCMYLILQRFHLPATLLQANFVYCFSTILGAISMLPGGIGGTEAGMVGLLAVMGIGYSAGLPAVILIRVSTLWLAVLVGVLFMTAMLGRSRARRNSVRRFH